MSLEYCVLCGQTHRQQDTTLCQQFQQESCGIRSNTMNTRRTTAARAAGSSERDDPREEVEQAVSLSLEEREARATRGIEELEAELRVSELEERFEALKLERERRRERRVTTIQDGGRLPVVPAKTQPSSGPPRSWGAEVTAVEDEYTTYCRSRARTREEEIGRPRTRSDSSATRRRRSKWSLKNYTIAGKEVRKLNAYELLGATMLWCLDIPDLSLFDYRSLIQHMHFICNRARDDHFKDCAHVEYDSAIRKMAEREGFEAFSRRNAGESIVHYGTQNSRPAGKAKGVSSGGARKRSPGGPGKGACYAWNGEAGCTRTEDECRFTHICSKCGSKGHRRYKCKD